MLLPPRKRAAFALAVAADTAPRTIIIIIPLRHLASIIVCVTFITVSLYYHNNDISYNHRRMITYYDVRHSVYYALDFRNRAVVRYTQY